MMQVAQEYLQAEGVQIGPEDQARLSLLSLKHVNVLGRFALADHIASGKLRPFKIEEWNETVWHRFSF